MTDEEREKVREEAVIAMKKAGISFLIVHEDQNSIISEAVNTLTASEHMKKIMAQSIAILNVTISAGVQMEITGEKT